ncbi:dTMP kinase [Actinomadura rupiterrae]|uniref:dTMP kinase n=1 Tax=Actinomadura rupiterrae TaxID=559627 RepID=UPI0020A4BC8B|nr:dTMP kinase [Actinomadura rupiterrae]MCP2343557.1 dTMP kinase [Actinomadura rupiterrae]
MNGLFVVVEGPNGVGKTTTARLLADRLTICGCDVRPTSEPTPTAWGRLIRSCEGELPARALALAVAADRAAHVVREIQPALSAGAVVVSDRYLPSSLVLQRLDGLTLNEIWRYNTAALRPSVTFYLEDDPDVLVSRLKERSTRSRLERLGSPARELELYGRAYEFLGRRGWRQARVDCRGLGPEQVVTAMLSRIELLHPHERNIWTCSKF